MGLANLDQETVDADVAAVSPAHLQRVVEGSWSNRATWALQSLLGYALSTVRETLQKKPCPTHTEALAPPGGGGISITT